MATKTLPKQQLKPTSPARVVPPSKTIPDNHLQQSAERELQETTPFLTKLPPKLSPNTMTDSESWGNPEELGLSRQRKKDLHETRTGRANSGIGKILFFKAWGSQID